MTERRHRWAVGLAISLFCAWGLFAQRLDLLIAHDEGLLGQTAERALGGELPHLDFDDTYTGGLTFLHAAAFALFGVRLAVLHNLLWLAACLFVAGFFVLAARHFGTWAAAVCTLVAVVWSLPGYFTPMPTWYNLFFALGLLLALDRYLRTRGSAWLLVAGLCGGLSIAVKLVGLYSVGAAALVVVYHHLLRQRLDRGAATRPEEAGAAEGEEAGVSWRWLPALLGIVVAGALVVILRRATTWLVWPMLGLPILALVAPLWREARRLRVPGRALLEPLGRDLAALALGVAPPLLLLLLPYLRVEGGLQAWWRGVFVLPQLRFEVAQLALPALELQALGLPLIALLLALGYRRPSWAGAALVAAACALLVAFGPRGEIGYVMVWAAARAILPIFTLIGLWRLANAAPDDTRGLDSGPAYALLAVAATFNLVQFPFASPQYFHYAAPLAVLVVGLYLRFDPAEPSPPPRRLAMLATAGAYYVIAAAWIGFSSHPFLVGADLRQKTEVRLFAPQRVGLRAGLAYAELYERLILATERLAPPDRPILALPDCPEVYYFTGRRNPTRLLFDALSAEPPTPAQLQGWLANAGLVVINREPKFSPPIDAATEMAIAARFPEKLLLGPYEVRYRRPP